MIFASTGCQGLFAILFQVSIYPLLQVRNFACRERHYWVVIIEFVAMRRAIVRESQEIPLLAHRIVQKTKPFRVSEDVMGLKKNISRRILSLSTPCKRIFELMLGPQRWKSSGQLE
jgi:hypothetical protein